MFLLHIFSVQYEIPTSGVLNGISDFKRNFVRGKA